MSNVLAFPLRFAQAFAGSLASKVKMWWLIIGVGGVLIGGYGLASQIHSSFVYERATATVTATSWTCAKTAGGPQEPCSAAEVEQLKAAKSKLTIQYRVTFGFTDKTGKAIVVTGFLTRTGLTREDAQPGATFDILYDPAAPTKTELPIGADYHSGLIGLVGLAALGLYVAMFWPWGGARPRPGAVAAALASRPATTASAGAPGGSFGRRQGPAR